MEIDNPCSIQQSQLVKPGIMLDNLQEETHNTEILTDKRRNIMIYTESETDNKESNREHLRKCKQNIEYEMDIQEAQTEHITRMEMLDYENVNKRDNIKKTDKTENLGLSYQEQTLSDVKETLKDMKLSNCGVCDAALIRTSDLDTHQSIHTTEMPYYKCDVCSVGFCQFSCLDVHNKKHTKDVTFRCAVCREVFITAAELKVHKITHRPMDEKSNMLGLCDTTMLTTDDSKKIQTREKSYCCVVCGVTCATAADLKEHKITHRTMENKSTIFGLCGTILTIDHAQKIQPRTEIKETSYKCDICGAKFSKSRRLIEHIRMHTGEKPYKCDVCNVKFSKSISLKLHKRIHTGEKPYRCAICGVRFNKSTHLKVHSRTHTNEKPFKCDVCGAVLSCSSALLRHKRIHTREKSYKCDICGVGFSYSSSLTAHRITHTEENPYKCGICGVGFSLYSRLKVHKRIHTGERPYKCDICGIGFSQSSHLKIHRRIHSGEKPDL